MFTPEEQAQIDALLAEATRIPKNGALVEDGYYWNRRLSKDESRLVECFMAEKHNIHLEPTRYEFKTDGTGHPLPRMFGPND